MVCFCATREYLLFSVYLLCGLVCIFSFSLSFLAKMCYEYPFLIFHEIHGVRLFFVLFVSSHTPFKHNSTDGWRVKNLINFRYKIFLREPSRALTRKGHRCIAGFIATPGQTSDSFEGRRRRRVVREGRKDENHRTTSMPVTPDN